MSKPTDEFRTPPAFYAGLNAEFRFDIDVAATEKNALCPRWIGPVQDALSCEWGTGLTAFCNPPYSQPHIPAFLAKAAEQAIHGVTSVLLVPLDPGSSWVQHVCGRAAEVRAVVGRLHFFGADGVPLPSCAPKCSALVVYRPYYYGPTLYSYIERRVIEAVGEEQMKLTGEFVEMCQAFGVER